MKYFIAHPKVQKALQTAALYRDERVANGKRASQTASRIAIVQALTPKGTIKSVDDLHKLLLRTNRNTQHSEMHTWAVLTRMICENWIVIDSANDVMLLDDGADYFEDCTIDVKDNDEPTAEELVGEAENEAQLANLNRLYDEQTTEYQMEQRVMKGVCQYLSNAMMGIDKRLAKLEDAAVQQAPPKEPEVEVVLVNIQTPINLKDRPLIDGTTLQFTRDEFDVFAQYIDEVWSSLDD